MMMKLWKRLREHKEPSWSDQAKIWGLVLLLGFFASAMKSEKTDDKK